MSLNPETHAHRQGTNYSGSADERLRSLFAILGRLDHASEGYGIKQPPLKNGAKISGIFEQLTALRILCEDESQLSLTLADPGSSVTVRDATGAVEYLG
jgi:hypothetical protein